MAFSEAELDELEWVEVHRYPLTQLLQSCSPAQLRAVAEALDYKPKAVALACRSVI
jgi:hypothetical protein